jgi:group I intron endonuclease
MRTIYLITNVTNQKKYIGQTKNLKRRLKSHFKGSKLREHSFARAIRKYGQENFEVSILEECDDDTVDSRERYWIEKFNTMNPEFGYNLESGGNACKCISQEAKTKMSNARKAWYAALSEEEKQAFRAKIKGKKLSNEHKEKLLASVKGIPKSEQHKQKIAIAHLTRVCKENCQCSKCVSRPSKRKKLSKEQEDYILSHGQEKNSSYKELAQLFNVSSTTISRVWLKKQSCDDNTTSTIE